MEHTEACDRLDEIVGEHYGSQDNKGCVCKCHGTNTDSSMSENAAIFIDSDLKKPDETAPSRY